MTVRRLDPMDQIAHWAENFAAHCRAVNRTSKDDSVILSHGLNSLVGALLDEGFMTQEVQTALNDALRNDYLKSSI